MRFFYESGNGDVVDFSGAGPYLASPDVLSSFEWSTSMLGSKVAGVFLESREATIDVWVSADSEREGTAAYRRMTDAFEYDLAREIPGTLDVYGYRAPVFAITCEPVEEDMHGMFEVSCKVTFLIDGGEWTRDNAYPFSRSGQGRGLNFPFSFPCDFGSGNDDPSYVENPGASPAPLTIVVYGPAENPRVSIANNAYEVEATVKSGGKLVVDGLAKTIDLFDPYGNAESVFNCRRGIQRNGSGSFVFQRIAPGTHPVSWDGSFAFEAILHEARSAPPLEAI
jgi:hypothetical protein